MTSTTEFLTLLASNADRNRFIPFPKEYIKNPEVLSQNDQNIFDAYVPTEDEFKAFQYDLKHNFQRVQPFIQDIKFELVEHKPCHASIKYDYEFKYTPLFERQTDINHRRRFFLFHGSKIQNWYSILKNGIKNMSNSKFMSVGAVYGAGVYLTNDISTAYHYGSCSFKINDQSITVSCVAVVEVLTDPEQFMKTPGIYVIPDDSLLIARSLWVVNKPNMDINELLTYYQNLAMSRLSKQIPPAKRLAAEIKKLEEAKYSIMEYAPTWISVLNPEQKLYKITLDDFPYYSPLITTDDKSYIIDDWIPSMSIVSVLK